MVSPFARSRFFFISFFLFPSFVLSREEALCKIRSIWTIPLDTEICLAVASSVTYCQPPETLLIDRFDIAFFPRNQSVSFNISAASVVCPPVFDPIFCQLIIRS